MNLNKASFILLICILCVCNPFVSTGQKNCVPESLYQKWELMAEADKKSNKQYKSNQIPLLNWPLRLASGFNYPNYYVINNYVDLDSGPGIEDYNCGAKSYNGHRGTDIDLDPFEWQMKNEGSVDVIAAAAGTIFDKGDGIFDENCNTSPCPSNTRGNYIIIQHNDGSRTLYYHMKRFSVTSKNMGDAVVQGEYLGKVGSSGCSSHPHLHFEVWNSQLDVVDPFAGTCNTTTTSSLWANQKPYNDTGINRIGTYSSIPVHPEGNGACPNTHTVNQKNHFTRGSSVYIQGNLRHTLSGIWAYIKVRDPNGSLVADLTYTPPTDDRYFLNHTFNTSFFSVLGKYTITLNYFFATVTHEFWLTDGCPSNRTLSNQTHNADRWYNASQTITSNSDSNAGVETLYNANNRITMTPGFSAKNGFRAYLGNACIN